MRLPFHLFSRSRNKIVDSFGRSDCGKVRTNNEDSFALLPERNLFIVADGMGGHHAGEVASRMAIEKTVTLCSQKELAMQNGNEVAMQHFLIGIFSRVNKDVMQASEANEAYLGMGTTLTLVYAVICCETAILRRSLQTT